MFGCVCCGYLCVLRSRWCLPRVKAIALSKLEQYDMVAEEEEETFRGAVQSQLSMGSEGSGKHKRFDDELYRLTRERARTMTVESLQPSSVKMQGMMIETHPQEAGHDDVTSEDSVQHKPPSQEQEESFPPRQHMESTGAPGIGRDVLG
ncbi:hypothetical protein GUITHDRAFT_107645 [Guillardia theta CCMP2712]|uniref:Uncharacterized protein n=1 Tax=Guillardia theta (strain CCMP2712) TaxID=905079 RepID=L1JD55_GUITC|nr:hypothetical protein GUITHDRAFT_107645 [Guillardia theta CCMP2712]EKX46441.1 hypothetical protein GUITHDRAFT_107645 [Guillardia theta CCMP2712]|eukprot:XP_005833421.1 hypothetical protein GUITHDRAFT_107645 [Guillardia theta CCMP2712]